MEIDCEAGGAVILSSDPQATAAFLQQTLQLENAAENGLQTGSFLLKVCPSNAALAPCCPDDMLLGLRHIALETDDIQNALHICKEKGLRLQTSEEGGPRFNGKVYGTGLHYFNILTDFGLILEITEKHPGSGPRSEKWAQGLGHIGIQVSNLQCSIAFLALIHI